MDASGHSYDEVAVGDSFSRSITITDTHLVLGAGLIGDFNPHHVNEEYAKSSRFGTRILHGMITSALMGAPVGMYFHGTAIAYLEHAARFKAPVRAGDTLTTTWTITDRHDKPKHGGGVVVLHGVCRNQEGTVVAEADGKMLVHAEVDRARRRGAGNRRSYQRPPVPARTPPRDPVRDRRARCRSEPESLPRRSFPSRRPRTGCRQRR
jgi:acyl dehydratase